MGTPKAQADCKIPEALETLRLLRDNAHEQALDCVARARLYRAWPEVVKKYESDRFRAEARVLALTLAIDALDRNTLARSDGATQERERVLAIVERALSVCPNDCDARDRLYAIEDAIRSGA